MEPSFFLAVIAIAAHLVLGLVAFHAYLKGPYEIAPFLEKILFVICGPLLWMNFLAVWMRVRGANKQLGR